MRSCPVNNRSVRVLRGSRRLWAQIVAGSMIGVIPISVLCTAGTTRWLLFTWMCAMVVPVWQLISPGRLELSATTLTVRKFGMTRTYELRQCAAFKVWRPPVGRLEYVVFDNDATNGTRVGENNRRRTGGSALLPDTYGMSATDLATLLNSTLAKPDL